MLIPASWPPFGETGRSGKLSIPFQRARVRTDSLGPILDEAIAKAGFQFAVRLIGMTAVRRKNCSVV